MPGQGDEGESGRNAEERVRAGASPEEQREGQEAGEPFGHDGEADQRAEEEGGMAPEELGVPEEEEDGEEREEGEEVVHEQEASAVSPVEARLE